MEKKMSGVLISYELFNDENTNLSEKCILSEILKYSDENGICNLNNQYLAQVLHLSKGTVSNIISTLTKKEYIELDFEYYEKTAVVSKRVIKIAERLKKFKEKEEIVETVNTVETIRLNETIKISETPIKKTLHENVDTIHEKMAGVHKNMDTPHEKMDTHHENVDTLHENMEDSLLKTSLLITSPLKINKKIDKKTRLECLNFLDKGDYRKLNNQTRDNIRKKYPELQEEGFCNIYKKLCDEEVKGRVKSFNAALYLAVENKWDFSEGNSEVKNKCEDKTKNSMENNNKNNNENNIKNNNEKIICEELKIRWFKSCFRGVKIDDYLDSLGKIPYETLAKNRGRLGRMSPFEFRSEFRKLVRKVE